MSLMMRVSQRTREGQEGPATLAVNRGIFLGAPRPVEGHRRHLPPWPSIISYPVIIMQYFVSNNQNSCMKRNFCRKKHFKVLQIFKE